MTKASNSNKPASESSQTGKKKAPKSSKPAEVKPKQLEWGSNPAWIQRAIEYLTSDVKFRLRLFSDTTSGAKAEGRLKVQASESKIALYGVLAATIFKTINDNISKTSIGLKIAFFPLKHLKTNFKHFQGLQDVQEIIS